MSDFYPANGAALTPPVSIIGADNQTELEVRAAAGQIVPLQRWQNSAGATVANMSVAGALTLGGGLAHFGVLGFFGSGAINRVATPAAVGAAPGVYDQAHSQALAVAINALLAVLQSYGLLA